jgi:hypothetical protein
MTAGTIGVLCAIAVPSLLLEEPLVTGLSAHTVAGPGLSRVQHTNEPAGQDGAPRSAAGEPGGCPCAVPGFPPGAPRAATPNANASSAPPTDGPPWLLSVRVS